MNLRKSMVAVAVWGMMSALAACQSSDTTSGSDEISAKSAVASSRLQPIRADAKQLAAFQQRAATTGVNVHVNKLAVINPDTVFHAEAGLSGQHDYIVVLADEPLASYKGGVAGYAATSPAAQDKTPGYLAKNGRAYPRLDTRSSAVTAYRSYLQSRQDAFVAQAAKNGLRVTLQHRYTAALNGFTTRLTQEQAGKLAQLGGVRLIHRLRTFKLNTDTGPGFIGAPQIWSGAATGGVAYQGEGLVAGIIDTGINTDHASFAAVGGDGYAVVNPFGEGAYKGDCVADASLCNSKLIGVYSYPEITSAYEDGVFWSEPFTGPRPANGQDYNGHGSHTASTVAGNVLLNVPLLGPLPYDGDGLPANFSFSRISGVAPHANIIAYQVCYPGDLGDPYAGCPESATLKAVEDAINDGVDIINYSIGGSEKQPWQDATELAFLAAREAGIFVAASAGNAGPSYSTADHVSPWLTSVAASTHSRKMEVSGKTLAGMSGGDSEPPATITGNGLTGAISGHIVWAGSVPNPNAEDAPELCSKPYPEGTFASTDIVVCARGGIARVTKAANVAAGGAGGFVLYNTYENYDLLNDVYVIPGIHIDEYSAYDLLAWLQSGSGHQATITAAAISAEHGAGDILAEFSSRGPSLTNPGYLVPAISGPGVDVYAAYSDEQPFKSTPQSADFSFLSGTSMASPHVAGAAALVRDAHPDWTPAEIQSALTSTASQTVLSNPWADTLLETEVYESGDGRVDLAKAVRAGLVLDETAENYRNADPANGGSEVTLNIAQLVNHSCRESCSWLRTVRATTDGSWTVQAQGPEYSVQYKAQPEEFTLRAGQTQTLLITASVLDSSTPISDSEVETLGEIRFVPADAALPTQHWPVSVKYSHGSLPKRVDAIAHRAQDTYTLKNISTPAIREWVARGYGLVAPEVHALSLAPDTDNSSAFDDFTDGVGVLWVDVPEDSVQLVVEIRDYPINSDAAAVVTVGLDVDADGVPEYDSEAICVSNSTVTQNYCVLNKPSAGRYWAVVQHWNGYSPPPTEAFSFTVGTAVVPKQAGGALSVEGPAQTDGTAPYDIRLLWNAPDAQQGDVLYGAFDLGTDTANAGNLGLIPVRILRGENDVTLNMSQTRAKAGNLIDFSIDVLANNTGADRQFALDTTLPEGLSLVADSVTVSANTVAELAVEGGQISVSGSQPDTSEVIRSYAMTTSDSDPNCTSGPDYGGGFIDLNDHGDFRIPQITGTQQNGLMVPWSNLFTDAGQHVPLFNREGSSGVINITAGGFAQLDGDVPFFLLTPLPMAGGYQPYEMLAVMHTGITGNLQTLYGSDDEGNPTGVSLAILNSAGDRDSLIVQWDGADTVSTGFCPFGGCPGPGDGNSFQFQVIANSYIDYEPGTPEIIFGYGALKGEIPKEGSVGLRGYHGVKGWFGPVEGTLFAEYAFDNLDTRLKANTLVCYDYVGPEQSQFKVRFKARVAEAMAGQTLELTLNNGVQGVESVIVKQLLVVNGNLNIAPIADQTVEEDGEVGGIAVLYTDAENGTNTIAVSGAHVTGTVSGNGPGALLTLKPEANFSGETTVTVTVADAAYPSDAASTSFTLTVAPADDAPVAAVAAPTLSATAGATVTLDGSPSSDPDGDTLSYAWTQTSGPVLSIGAANTAQATVVPAAAGSYSFELTVSDGAQQGKATVALTVTGAPSDGGSGGGGGGAFNVLQLLWLFGLFGLRGLRYRRN